MEYEKAKSFKSRSNAHDVFLQMAIVTVRARSVPIVIIFPPSGRCRCCYIIIISLSAIIVVLFSFCTILLFLLFFFYCYFRGELSRCYGGHTSSGNSRALNAQVNGASLI